MEKLIPKDSRIYHHILCQVQLAGKNDQRISSRPYQDLGIIVKIINNVFHLKSFK